MSRGCWLLGFLALLPLGLPAEAATAAAATACEQDWEYSVASLQAARNLLKSPARQDVRSRINCGRQVLDALDRATLPEGCAQCRREYARLLLDHIARLRALAEGSASANNRKHYYEQEIATRQRFGEFLASSGDEELAKAYWSRNFEGLGDAMERAHFGQQYHEEALSASHSRIMSDKSFKTWARAIRSCEEWDFASGPNRDMVGLRKSLLCEDECRQALSTIRQRVQEGRVIDQALMTQVLDGLLPALESCPAERQP